MAESIIGWLLLMVAVCYGVVRLLLAIAEAEEEKRRAGERAWQEWERI